ncbi:MAG: hypothetical protein HOY69_21360, partial [Streptomyces sp.]|nr:hypothetical protein [Streptomyces sp.]
SVAGAGPTYTEGGSSKRTVSSSHTTTTVTIYRAASTEPHAEIVTPYTMRITLEADDTPHTGGASGRTAEDGTTSALDRFRGRRRIVEEHAVGGLREHVPLSLMQPAPPGPSTPGTGSSGDASGTVAPGARRTLPAPDPGADPALARAPRPTPVPPVRREVTVVYGDGVRRPFTFPENGFHPRAVIGVDNIRAANDLLLTRSYDAGFSLTALESPDGPDAATLTALLRTTRTTGLTRLGTGSAQALEDGTSHMAVTAFYPRTLEPEGYRIAGLTEKSFLGTDDGELSLRSTPDFSRALLLTVADGKKLEVLRRHGENAGTSSAGEHTQGGNLGGGFLYDSPSGVGLNQIGLFVPGPNALDGDGMPVGDDHLTSRNLKPKTGRTFLFAIPTTFVGVGDVHRTFKDAKAVTFLRGTFGHVRPGPQAMESEAYVVAWVREDVARELLLITDENFPASVGTSWDAVGKASKGWVDADQAYWKKRRTAIHLRDAVRTAETAAIEARNRVNPLLDAAEAADTALELAEADAATAREAARDLDRAADALDTAEARLKTVQDTARADRATAAALVSTAQATLDMLPGWAELPGNELPPDHLERATADLATARRRADELRAAADRAVETARRARDEAADRLAALEQAAPGTTTPLTPAADAARARQTADARREAADRRVDGARTRQTAAARRLDQPARAEAAATERLQAARDAFEVRRQDLERLRAAADTAAAEYHRVRAATDQLTRWHRLAATSEGRRQLDGLEEPPAVTYQAPPKPTAPSPPDRPRYTRTATEEHTLLTSPGGRQTYVLSEVDHDGDAFFHALLHGLSGAAPELLAAAGIDAASPDAVPQLRRRLAARLTDPADVDLLAFVTPDETDSFTAREVSDAGLDLGTDTPVRREFEALGVIPHAADLSAEARAGLAVAQLLRRGDAESERGWNHSAADLLPMLAARTFGVRITVVRADGTFDDFDPASARAGRGLEGLIDDAGAPRPQVVLSLADRHYQPARPLGQPPVTEGETALIKAVPPVGDGHTTARPSTGGDATSVAPPAPPGGSPRRVDTDGRSFTVRPVPGDGDCLFHAVLDSIAAQHPGRSAPGPAVPLPQVRDDLARWYTESADAASFRALHAAQDPVETLVADLFPGLTTLQDLLGHDDPPDLTDEQRDGITRQLSHDRRRADLRALAADDQERELLS